MDEQYVDWSKIPEGYDWVAIDSPEETEFRVKMHGIAILPNCHGVGCYKGKPKIKNDMGRYYYDLNHHDQLVGKDAIIAPLPPWRESLRNRPGA